MRILAGFLTATSGKASIDGKDVFWDPIAARRRIGYMPENCPIYADMRVDEYLRFRGGLKGLAPARMQAAAGVCRRTLLASRREAPDHRHAVEGLPAARGAGRRAPRRSAGSHSR